MGPHLNFTDVTKHYKIWGTFIKTTMPTYITRCLLDLKYVGITKHVKIKSLTSETYIPYLFVYMVTSVTSIF